MSFLYSTFLAITVLLGYGMTYPLSQFYPFGATAGDSNLPANDDGSTSSIHISVPFPFFGSSYTSVFVNNNGDVTFDAPLSQFTSQAFPISGSHKIIAPFWTDIDTRQGGYLYYRTTTQSAILQRGTNKIRSLFPNIFHFSASWMMVVTWEDVAAYGCSPSGTITCQQWNTFQLVLITNGIQSFVVFNYNKITWTKSSQVGFNAGDGVNYFAVPGSMTDSMLNLPQMSNIGIPGQFVFRVDQTNITNADVIDECASSPCVHGNCSNQYEHYVCICQPGYTGVNCETEIDECQSSPCIHGNCSDHLNHYTCHCLAGYTGSNCQTDIDECSSSPCVHGSCTDLINGYVCNCIPGYTGRLCEIDIDECQSSPCFQGNCSDAVNHYTCHCFAGFTGSNCDIDIDECASSPCVHGNCTDKVNGYICNCVPGYTGVLCETEINECASSPCQQGICIDEINDYRCICNTAYFGRQCSYFNLLYLWPLILGLLMLLTVFVLIFLWKRYKRNKAEDTREIFMFNDVSIGPGKMTFLSMHGNHTPFPIRNDARFLNDMYTNLLKMAEKIRTLASKVVKKVTSFKINRSNATNGNTI
uniref:Sushi, nidogen and EGF-like domain-containing protein 1 n=1 Tax=Crassostrea virginica TaxID=6565 RepID=A0A8B8DS82_CRAVI|nr:sushi, nidogen and EGF-like domain-containing protein 1 [Crassostrea virginica]